MTRPVRAVGLACTAILVAAACGAGRIDVADGPVGAPAGATPAPSASAVPPPAAQSAEPVALVDAGNAPSSPPEVASDIAPDAGVLPRSVSYAILRWTVTDAVITTQDPNAYVAGVAGSPTAKTSLIVDLDIRNDDVHVSFVSTGTRLVAVLPDGTVVPGRDLMRSGAPPVSSVEGRYAFTIPAGTAFDGLVLRWEDPGREPSLDLPLGGPAPEIEADATTDTNLKMDVAIPGIEMRWTIDKVLVGRDWPLSIGFKGGTLVPGARAESGDRWVGVVARVDVGRCACKGGVLDQTGSARLLVDGLPYTASAADTSNMILNASTFSDVLLVFAVPASATTAVLQVGPLEEPGQQATAVLDLGAGR